MPRLLSHMIYIPSYYVQPWKFYFVVCLDLHIPKDFNFFIFSQRLRVMVLPLVRVLKLVRFAQLAIDCYYHYYLFGVVIINYYYYYYHPRQRWKLIHFVRNFTIFWTCWGILNGTAQSLTLLGYQFIFPGFIFQQWLCVSESVTPQCVGTYISPLLQALVKRPHRFVATSSNNVARKCCDRVTSLLQNAAWC